MDNATYDYSLYFDTRCDSEDPQTPHTPSFIFCFKLVRQLSLSTSPETTSLAPTVRLSAEELSLDIPRAAFSAELMSNVVARMRFPPDFADALAASLSSHALGFATDPLFADEPTLSLGTLITATIPYQYDESLETDRASSESAEAGFDEVAPRPASGSAIAGLKEVSLERDAGSSCTICLEDLVPLGLEGDGGGGDRVAVLKLPCSHVFHKDCIVRWLESSQLCPLCRYALPT